MKKQKRSNGITLIALVITIVILLILAGISIATITSENGILKNSVDAKVSAEISTEKEMVQRAVAQSMGQNSRGLLKENEFQKKLDSEAGNEKTEVTDIGDEFEVWFKETNRVYTVSDNGDLEEVKDVVFDKNPGDITKDKNGNNLDGTEEKPYEIWCIEDLVALSNMVNGSGKIYVNGELVNATRDSFKDKYVKLKTTLNFKSKLSYQDSERTDFGDINGNDTDGNKLIEELSSGTGFIPIGFGKSFDGIFDGENNQIKEIFINYENDTNLTNNLGRAVGLFGVGNITSTVIKNLTVSGQIKGRGHTGGIIGINANCIENCVNDADVLGFNIVGGIAGGYVKKIVNCINNGQVEISGSTYQYAGIGGIIGFMNSEFEMNNSSNTGNVIEKAGNANVGGLIGTTGYNVNIDNCCNSGRLIDETNGVSIGGLIGLYREGILKIYNSTNMGQVEGKDSGGIIGSCNLPAYTATGSCYIENCYNIANIKDNTTAGGIVGKIGGYAYKEMNVYITNCYNIGNISGGINGGIVGGIYNTSRGEKAQSLYIDSVYYLSNSSTKSIGRGDPDEGNISEIVNVNTTEFEEKLNSYKNDTNQYPSNWLKWKIGEKGYPEYIN